MSKESIRNNDRKILLLGSGFVAGPCAEYILRRPENHLTIASRRLANAQVLARRFPERTTATTVDVSNSDEINALVAQHDLVISLIPYTHHATVIDSAIKHRKHVVTTSYVSDAMMALDARAKDAGITVINEVGLDPGIDHLYAVKTIDEVHAACGKITGFLSYCGGLPAPECSDNPLGYKFSWSSRGVLLALRNNAKLFQDGKLVDIDGKDLMKTAKPINTGFKGYAFVGYPNRDSTPYKERYNIPEAQTIIRGTLRYDGFQQFVKVLVDLGMLSDEPSTELQPTAAPITWCELLKKVSAAASATENDLTAHVLAITTANGFTQTETTAILDGFRWLGLFSEAQVPRRGTLLDSLCATLEERMTYGKGERDLVFLQHRFEVELADGTKQTRTSTLVEYGQPNGTSAMAKTVGVPCGIAAQLVLDGRIARKGVLAPMDAEINTPIMELLEREGITMAERIL